MWRGIIAVVVVAAGSLAAIAAPTAGPSPGPAWRPAASEPIAPIPLQRDWDPKRVAVGERLFHDARLSRDQARSCATCHPLDRGGMDSRSRPVDARGALNRRNTPTIFNVGLSASFNWDGIADTLESHAETVLRNPSLMDITWPELLGRLEADAAYVTAFRELYQGGLSRPAVLDALATFERSLETPDSRFDRYLRGDRDAVSPSERRGYALFKEYGCAACHQGVNVGGNMYQRFGVFQGGDVQFWNGDLGRFQVTGIARDRGVFRVPSLRTVAATAPYFHDGRAGSLEVAVETMARVQLGKTLQPAETALIVEFLGTLTGRYRGRLIVPDPAPRAGGVDTG
jgi:cytochrome c peroxidase